MVAVAASTAGTGVGSSPTAAQETTAINNNNTLDNSPKSFNLPAHNVSREPHQAQWRY